jgi:WD40 repeat protein
MADDAASPAAEAPPAEETPAAPAEAAPAAPEGDTAAAAAAPPATPAAEGEAGAAPTEGDGAAALAEGEGGGEAEAAPAEPEEPEEPVDETAEDPGEFDYEANATPLFISGPSQIIYKCVIDGENPEESVTEENPRKDIPHKEVLHDMQQRAGVSDFAPVKDTFKKYKGENVLVVYDPDFALGDNFFTFFTPAKRQTFLDWCEAKRQWERLVEFKANGGKKKKAKAVHAEGDGGDAEEEEEEESEEEEEEEKEPRREGPWESLGSEAEVAEVEEQKARSQIKIVISRRRRYFGAPTDAWSDTTFQVLEEGDEGYDAAAAAKQAADVTAEGGAVRTLEIPALTKDHDDEEEYVAPLQQMLHDMGVQAIPVVESASSQTTWPEPRNATTQYVARKLETSTSTSTSTATDATDAGPAVPTSRATSARGKSSKKGVESPEPPPVDPLTAFMNRVTGSVSHSLRENEIVDLFSNDFANLIPEEDSHGSFQAKGTDLQEFQSFKFITENETTITAVQWHPTIPGVVAVACSLKQSFNERVERPVNGNICHVLLWRLSNPIDPVVLLEAPDDIYSIAFNPDDPDVLAGGCINGQVVLWNLQMFRSKLERVGTVPRETKTEDTPGEATQTKTPVLRYEAVTAIEYGHRCSVMDIQWLPTEMYMNNKGHMVIPPTSTTTQLISIAADETAMVWDVTPPEDKDKKAAAAAIGGAPVVQHEVPNPWALKGLTANAPWKATIKDLDLNWRPVLKVFLNTDANTDNGGRRFCFCPPPKDFKLPKTPDQEYDTSSLSSNIFVGTERGAILYLDWQPPESDSGKLGVQKVKTAIAAHHGPVNTLKRSPFIPELLLSVGGSSFAIWKEDLLEKPIVEWLMAGSGMTDGEWSPQRPGVFFISKADGSVDIWDLCDTSYTPTVTAQVCSPSPITSLRISPLMSAAGQCFMAASDDNAVLHVLEIPVALRQAGKNELQQMEHLIENEIIRIKASLQPKNWGAAPKEVEEEDDEDAAKAKVSALRKVYNAFLETERNFLMDMGLATDDPAPDDED